MSIEKRFDVEFIAGLALREKQIQQNYRPIIAVHKWFARRPGTLFRGLILAEFGEGKLREEFFRAHDFAGIHIGDPFMGGGTPLIEANRLGCDITGFDINPMAYWIVREEIEHLDLVKYREAANRLVAVLRADIGHLYLTRCTKCSSTSAAVKYWLWVKTINCENCRQPIDLFPGYLVAEDRRHTANVLLCPSCRELNEVADLDAPGLCKACRTKLLVDGPAHRSSIMCSRCEHRNRYPNTDECPRHTMFAIEYYCDQCRNGHQGRFFKRPDMDDLARFDEAEARVRRSRLQFVPEGEIEPGDETNRLLRWGYRKFRDMFGARQLLGLELSARFIAKVKDDRVRRALQTNFSDLLRYQNMLCRYDTMALKSLDIFSVHGFPVGLVQCESNFLGIRTDGGVGVGSGGWDNIISKYEKAKAYCDRPFEVRVTEHSKQTVYIPNEWIGENRAGSRSRRVDIQCADSSKVKLTHSLDAIFTDPPYFENIQYAELMEFCFVWLQRLAGHDDSVLRIHSIRDPEELTGNQTQERGLNHFTTGLSRVFQAMGKALKPGRPLVFTYHHNRLEAYHPLAVAILDAGFLCTAAIPCPAEMGGSIHINGTSSSILDTVLVCRHGKHVVGLSAPKTPKGIAATVVADMTAICNAGHTPTAGDANCIINGHLTRAIILALVKRWKPEAPIQERLAAVAQAFMEGPQPTEIKAAIEISGGLPTRAAERADLFTITSAE